MKKFVFGFACGVLYIPAALVLKAFVDGFVEGAEVAKDKLPS